MTTRSTPTPFQLGDPVTHRGIVVTPLFPALDPRASYITLDEALPRGLVITETSDAGSVPELAVVNPLAENVLLYDGEELVGAKQNRILNVSVLVGAGAKLPIPVSCVEQGRWARSSVDFDSATHISHAHLRRRKAEMLAAQPLARGPRRARCGGDRREAAADVGLSPTGAARDTFVAHGDRLRALEDAFPLQPGQCGAVLAIGGDLCLDAVSRPGRSRSSGRSSGRLPPRRAGAARRQAHPRRADRRLRGRGRRRGRHPRPLRRPRQRRAAARPRRGRLGPRARRRADPAQRRSRATTAARGRSGASRGRAGGADGAGLAARGAASLCPSGGLRVDGMPVTSTITHGSSPTIQASWPGACRRRRQGRTRPRCRRPCGRPSAPRSTNPVWVTWQEPVPTIGCTCDDQRQPRLEHAAADRHALRR